MWSRKKKEYEYTIKGNSVSINIYQKNGKRHVAYIDLKYLDKFLNHKYAWGVSRHVKNNQWYVVATIYLGTTINGKSKNRRLYLHKYLLNVPKKTYIDHINGNTLDNRTSNLRLTTHKNNNRNRQGRNRNNKSGYRNVCLINRWYRVQLQINDKNYRFPEKFNDVNDAGTFAKEMRLKYYGEFAGKN
jgi:hypothetical protein